MNDICISHIRIADDARIICQQSVFISLAVLLFASKVVFRLRVFMDIQKCVCFKPLQLHNNTDFVHLRFVARQFIVTPFSIRMEPIWTLLWIASIVCYDAASSIAHSNTKNVFIHRTSNHCRIETLIHPCSMQVRKHERHSHQPENSEKFKTLPSIDGIMLNTHAHNDFRFDFHLFRSYCSILWACKDALSKPS